ncbi:Signal transduction histidine kinase [Filimonas lacunae]|uniref:histidine kinase n=2 Tax=Filimonas lacunae TaxID=477680 RepID=A0A173MQ04_9BACT|nr:sensor histidine kinase [Filimonas lacunae]SIS77919.1 Signal transduction histidine kinase [Filimonas lacunae]
MINCRKTLLLFVVILYTGIYCKAQDKVINIFDRKDDYSLHPNTWSLFKTNDEQLSIDSLVQLYQLGNFKPVNTAVYNAGIARKQYWFHFAIHNQGSGQTQLMIDAQCSRINELELFEKTKNGIRSLGKLGDFYPFEQRTSLHKNFQYALTLDKGEQKDYFLHINQVGHTFLLPLKIYKDKAFEAKVNRSYLSDGITYGILVFVSIFSFLFYINTKHKLYLYYGLYILTSIIWFLGYFGLGFEFIWSGYPPVNSAITATFSSINLLLNIQISQVLLNMRATHPYLYKWGNICKVMLAAVAIIPIFVNLNTSSFQVNNIYICLFLAVIVISIVTVLISLLVTLMKGSVEARFYFSASIIKVIGIFNLALLEWGVVGATYYTETMLQAGILIEIILLTYAIARRYTSYKLKTYQKIIQAQEIEKANSAKEIHDSLSGTLTAIRFKLLGLSRNVTSTPAELIEEIDIISDYVSTAQAEARNISHNLMPAYIKDHSLNRIIELYIQDLHKKITLKAEKPLDIHFISQYSDEDFPEEVRLNIFRIVQEIMTNIIKHAHATTVTLEFAYRKKNLLIIAEDNGVGFDPSVLNEKKGIGLRNIESRVQLLNGAFHMSNGKKSTSEDHKNGTRIFIRIPSVQHSNRDGKDY